MMEKKNMEAKVGFVYPTSTAFRQASLRELEMKGLIENRMLLL